MYHIKNDKRAQTSARMICDAVQKYIQNNSMDNLTISKVQELSGVSRSTFYRLFDNIEDVIELLLELGFNEIYSNYVKNVVADNTTYREAMFNYWFSHSRMIECVVEAHRIDLFSKAFKNTTLELNFIRIAEKDETKYNYFISILSSVMVGILTTWVENGKKESKEELGKILSEELNIMNMVGLF